MSYFLMKYRNLFKAQRPRGLNVQRGFIECYYCFQGLQSNPKCNFFFNGTKPINDLISREILTDFQQLFFLQILLRYPMLLVFNLAISLGLMMRANLMQQPEICLDSILLAKKVATVQTISIFLQYLPQKCISTSQSSRRKYLSKLANCTCSVSIDISKTTEVALVHIVLLIDPIAQDQ